MERPRLPGLHGVGNASRQSCAISSLATTAATQPIPADQQMDRKVASSRLGQEPLNDKRILIETASDEMGEASSRVPAPRHPASTGPSSIKRRLGATAAPPVGASARASYGPDSVPPWRTALCSHLQTPLFLTATAKFYLINAPLTEIPNVSSWGVD